MDRRPGGLSLDWTPRKSDASAVSSSHSTYGEKHGLAAAKAGADKCLSLCHRIHELLDEDQLYNSVPSSPACSVTGAPKFRSRCTVISR